MTDQEPESQPATPAPAAEPAQPAQEAQPQPEAPAPEDADQYLSWVGRSANPRELIKKTHPSPPEKHRTDR